MTQEDYQANRDGLHALVDATHRITAIIVVISFAGYALAAYLWFQGAGLGALLVATLSYLLFRMFRPISLSFARLRLQRHARYAPTLVLLDTLLQTHNIQQVFAQIAAFTAAESESQAKP